MRYLFIILLLLSTSGKLFTQSSRNGYHLPVSGTIRFFVVFAEATNDPQDPGSGSNWTSGQMPDNPEEYYDHTFTDAESIVGYITKYYYQGSFGRLIVLGDYYEELVQINFNTMNGDGTTDVINYLHNLTGNDLLTENDYEINANHFDYWTETTNLYSKTNSSDDI